MTDVIDRKAAIDALHRYFDGMLETDTWSPCDVYGLIEILPSAQPELIEREAYIRGFEQGKTQGRLDTLSAQAKRTEERTETHACDLISRQAAIDAISCNIIVTGKQNAELVAATIGTFVDRIKALPPVQPEVLACGEGELIAQSEIIRCKGCKNWNRESICDGFCSEDCMRHDEDFYCGNAERRTDGIR